MAHPAVEVVNGLIDLVFPPRCLACDTLGADFLCESCLKRIEPIPEPACPTCGHTTVPGRCGNCAGRVRSFTRARAVGQYDGTLREAIQALKYSGRRMLADPLGDLMYDYLDRHADIPWRKVDCIIPVPIHPTRQRVRGYNQSDLLARRLAVRTGLPATPNLLSRVRRTRPQVRCTREERRTNLLNAFRAGDPGSVCGRNILLVDDVATTCSTIHEASIALRRAGAARIYVLCLAYGG